MSKKASKKCEKLTKYIPDCFVLEEQLLKVRRQTKEYVANGTTQQRLK